MMNKENFYKQLKSFASDNSYKEKYAKINIKESSYLVEIFKYIDSEGNEEDIKLKDPSPILVHDLFGNLTSATNAYFTKFTHIAKVLKIGQSIEKPLYKEGDIVLLNPKETVGTTYNPDFLLMQQYRESNMTPILPEGMPEKIGTIQRMYEDYFFLMPEEFDKPNHETNTFCLPSHKIKAQIDI